MEYFELRNTLTVELDIAMAKAVSDVLAKYLPEAKLRELPTVGFTGLKNHRASRWEAAQTLAETAAIIACSEELTPVKMTRIVCSNPMSEIL